MARTTLITLRGSEILYNAIIQADRIFGRWFSGVENARTKKSGAT